MRELAPEGEAAQEEAVRASAAMVVAAAGPILALQRQAGNRAVAQLVLARRPWALGAAAGRAIEQQARPPGSAEFARLIGSDAAARGQFVFTSTLHKRVEDKLDGYLK